MKKRLTELTRSPFSYGMLHRYDGYGRMSLRIVRHYTAGVFLISDYLYDNHGFSLVVCCRLRWVTCADNLEMFCVANCFKIPLAMYIFNEKITNAYFNF